MKSFSLPFVKKTKLKNLHQEIVTLQAQIATAADFISEIEKGNLEINIREAQSGEDELSNQLTNSLINLQKQMIRVSAEEEQRNWVSETRSNFMDILRNRDNDLKALSDSIITNLIKCLSANQGGLYLINDDETHDIHIQLLACYAYERKKYLTQRIEIGEGLVGQVIMEKEYIYLTEIPEDYLKITSGLGESNPRHLLIVPLKIEDKVYGAIEIASFHGFKEYEIEFTIQLCESIASTISNVKNNARTQQLLEDTQQQAEEMRSQGEELQQNMEELQATQEEMQRKASEIESRMIAIDESGIASIEFELDGSIVNANTNFLKLMGYTLDEIEGKHHRIFISSDYAKSDEYVLFWKDLSEGKAHSGEYERFGKGGKQVFIQGSYSILRDSKGEPKSVIKLAADITSTKQAQEELQQQAEIMRAQEEELRQNLEELSATQEEIERRSSEIESRMIAIDESGIASIEFELDGTIINANTNFLKLMGYPLDEIKGKHHRMFVTEAYAKSEEYRQFWKDLAEGKARSGEYERFGKGGKQVFIQGSYSILRDSKGEPKSVIKLAADITSTKQAQEELQQQAEEMKAQDEELRQNLEELAATQEEIQRRASEIESRMTAINESGIASIEFELDGTILNANANFLKLMGYTLEEIKGKHHCIFVTEEHGKSEEYRQFWKDLAEGKARFGEYERFGKHDKQVFIQGSYSIIRDSQGEPKSVIKLAADITSAKLAQEELQQQTEEIKAQEEELRQNLEELSATQEEIQRRASEIESRMIAIDESGIASIEFELDGTIVSANANFLKLMGYQLEEIEGKHHRIFVAQEYAKSKEYAQFWKDLSEGNARFGEYERLGKNGKQVFIQGSYSILRDSKGEPKRVIKLAADITSNKQTQEEMKRIIHTTHDNEKLSEGILNALQDSTFAINNNYELISFNEVFKEKWAAQGKKAVKGVKIQSFFSPKEWKEQYEVFYVKALAGEAFTTVENKKIGKKELFYNVSYSPIKDKLENVVAVTIIARDITEIEHMRLENERLLNALKHSAKK